MVLAGAVYVWSQVHSVLSVSNVAVSYTVPDAPHLVAGNGETVYRIDPTHSSMTYGVDENIIGQTAHHATGSTNGIAGDLALNAADPSASRVGKIVVNVEQLHSDNNLRDAAAPPALPRVADHPLVTFSTTKLTGLPSTVVDGPDLHVHDVGQPDRARRRPLRRPGRSPPRSSKGKLDATATTTVKMSTFGVGPINLAGLVSTGDNGRPRPSSSTALDPSKYTVPDHDRRPGRAGRVGQGPVVQGGGGADPRAELRVVPPARHRSATPHWQLTTAGDAAKVADGLGSSPRPSTCRRGRRPTRRAAAALQGAQPEGHRHDRGVGRGRRQARRAGVDADHAGQVEAGHACPAPTS